MRIQQHTWRTHIGTAAVPDDPQADANLVLGFGAREVLERDGLYEEIRTAYPRAEVLLASTAGEIRGTDVLDDALVLTAVTFDRTGVRGVAARIHGEDGSHQAGADLADQLAGDGLAHVFVLSDGLQVNGSALIRGLAARLPEHVQVTGGLAGDAGRFERTLVGLNGTPGQGIVAAVGLYGDAVRIGYGSLGGWDPFGPERRVTRSEGNVLFELDNTSALELYRRYLGEHAAGLPASGLLFPLSIRPPEGGATLVRTILGVNDEDQSLTFAGEVPEGWVARLMKANFDRLIDGASGAARGCLDPVAAGHGGLAILISCVGRKMVLGQRTEEEVESVREVLGDDTVLTGFYSYGEISPVQPTTRCELHNQTMTITTVREV